MASTPKIYASLQVGRAVAALMVVLFHASAILGEPKYWRHSFQQYFLCGRRGVEIFFVLSGIVILNAHRSDIDGRGSLKLYLRKRFLRIYPIYWIVLLVITPVFVRYPSMGTGMERRPSVIVSSFLLVHFFEKATVLTVAWTLYHEVMFYAVFAFLIVNRRIGLWVLGAWMGCSAYALVRPPLNPVAGVYLSPLHLLFGLGMGTLLLVHRRSVPAPRWLLAAGIAAFAGGCVYENLSRSDAPGLSLWYGLAASLCALAAMEMERSRQLRIPRFVGLLGDASYSIYLVHFPLLSVMAKVLYSLWLRVPVPLWVVFMTMLVSATALGITMHLCLERPLLARLRPRKGMRPTPADGIASLSHEKQRKGFALIP